MIAKIQTSEDVRNFAKQLIAEGINFHPDDDFHDTIDLETDKPTYSSTEADLRNELMSQCFEVCEQDGLDIYDISMEVTLKETGLDKVIPLPSQRYSENN